MCYDIRYLTKKKQDYARRFGEVGTDLSVLDYSGTKNEAGDDKLLPVYHTNGFQHRDVPLITNTEPEKISFFTWGLIPFWVKDVKTANKVSNSTLNARGEELSEKASFRSPAKSKRCLVMVDGFFEHHHKNSKVYPYHIQMEDETPFALAGLWEKWELKSEDIVRYTFSIVTTKGNSMLADIHNNPKLDEPRMPVIVRKELDEVYLKEEELNEDEWAAVLQPFPSKELKSHTVPRLRGKEYMGNNPGIVKYLDYPELNSLFD